MNQYQIKGVKTGHPKLCINKDKFQYLLRTLIKIGAPFYRLGALYGGLLRNLQPCYCYPTIKWNMHTQRGGVILHVPRLHVKGAKKLERKFNQNTLLTYLLGRNW